MARPKKIGLDYFPVDTVFDQKIQAIELLYQNDGLVWILKFWQSAYQTETGEVNLCGLFGELHAKNCRITIEKHAEIIKSAIEISLIYKTESGLYSSNGIKKRISAVSKDRQGAIQRQEEIKSKSKVKERKPPIIQDYSANNSEEYPGASWITTDCSASEKNEEVQEKEKYTWRTDFKIYEAESLSAIKKIMSDPEWLAERQRYHPKLNIQTSLEKAFNDFWGTEAGWMHKKKSRSKTIDWPATFANALTMRSNQVWRDIPRT